MSATSERQSGKWTKRRIITELRQLHRQGEPMWSRRIRETHSALYAAAIHRMGSYANALTEARIDYAKVRRLEHGRWNRETVAAELKKLHRAKHPLHHAALERERPELVIAAYRYFRSYAAAIKAAGLDYTSIRIRPMPSWDRRRVVRELKALRQQRHGLWRRAVRRASPYLERAARKHFGSYERAIEESGIPTSLIAPPPYRSWSPERVIGELKALYRLDRRMLKPSRLVNENPKLLRAARRRFGTYANALKAAGISYAKVARVTLPPLTKEQIVKTIANLFDHGADIRYAAMARQHARVLNAARSRFGTYARAVEAAGIEYPPPVKLRHWTARNVLANLRRLYREGNDLRVRAFRAAHVPLYQAAKHYFGTYQDAVKRAGIVYADMVREQLGKQTPNRKLART